MFLYQVISFAFNVFDLLIIARALISWIQVDPYNPIVQFLFRTTEPFLAPVRRLMAQYFPNLGFDLSPIVVLILAQIVESLVLRLLFF